MASNSKPHSENVFISDIKNPTKSDLVGGKTFNIFKLIRNNINTPKGFCITTKALEYYMDFNNITPENAHKITEGEMPPDLKQTIQNAYHTYIDGTCAVRSSGTAEDLQKASFAGQYQTVLNVGYDTLCDAVKECWASLWSIPAVEYRKHMKIHNASMAVLVQDMIPATCSGVLFTGDTITIEAVYGLGDILVGGEVVPDKYTVDRKNFSNVTTEIASKPVMSQAGTHGVEKTPVPASLRETPVLTQETMSQLCEISLKIEDIFGCPQDIEWGIHNNDIIIFQARPITVEQLKPEWTRANISEMQPGYVTYLSRPPENRPDFFVLSTLPLLQCFGIKDVPKDIKFAEYIYGHIYINLTNAHNIICQIPGLTPEVFDRSIGHTSPQKVPPSKFTASDLLRVVPGVLRILRLILHLPGQIEEVTQEASQIIEDMKTTNFAEKNLQELNNLVWKMYDINQKVFQVHSCNALVAAPCFDILRTMVQEYGEGTENILITGLEGMSSYRLGVEMWKLAQKARQWPRVSQVILTKDHVCETLKTFQEGNQFLTEFYQFTDAYGDRCYEEPELSTPRWGENPEFVLSMVANYLQSDTNPEHILQNQIKKREETTRHILDNMNFFKRFIFKKVLEKEQYYIITRENTKTVWTKSLAVIRSLYLNIADILVDKGIIEDKTHIFFLKMTEVSEIISGALTKNDVKPLIHNRKQEKETYQNLDVPDCIVGSPPPIDALQHDREPTHTLTGTGCSPGVVTGKAKVVSTPGECTELKKGDILVAPVTDPGWSPLFVTAGGLVMELGSSLSHGVIIAREYGIPAVVGVKNATSVIESGQIITVDGTQGTVSIRD